MKGILSVLVTLTVLSAASAIFIPREESQETQFQLDNIERKIIKEEAEDDIDMADQFLKRGHNDVGGAVYIRWGKRECPSSATRVYNGVAGASRIFDSGGGSNYLCLPNTPEYHKPQEGRQPKRTGVYSVEYRGDFPPLTDVINHDVPCVVCKARRSRSSMLMIPARRSCPGQWTLEYNGFLMAERSSNYRTEYICLDKNPENRPGTTSRGNANTHAVLQPVEGMCSSEGGGLPCEPYIDGYELTCVVCTS